MLCLFETEGYFSFVMWYWLFSVCFSLFPYSVWLYRRRTRTKTSVSVHSMTFLTCLRHGNSWERSSLARRWETLWPSHTNRLYALVFLYKRFLSICFSVHFIWIQSCFLSLGFCILFGVTEHIDHTDLELSDFIHRGTNYIFFLFTLFILWGKQKNVTAQSFNMRNVEMFFNTNMCI